MRTVVTGASGLLGAEVARALVGRGDDVTVLQRRPSGLPCREVLADIADADAVATALRGADAVVHLAAKVSITGRWDDYARANVAGTRNVVRGCLSGGVGRLVQVSTPSVAHAGRALVGAEAAPASPADARGHYARSKAVAERLALDADGPDLAVVAVRPHLVWGPGDTQLVGRLVERARAGRLALVGSGTALIDTVYVDNAVDALVAALERAPIAHGRAVVVSNGEPRTVAEVVGRICAAAGVRGPRGHVPYGLAYVGGAVAESAWSLRRGRETTLRRGREMTLRRGREMTLVRGPDEPPMTRFLAEQLATAHWFDQRGTRELLGWAPRIGLDEGFARLASWYAAQR